MEQQRKKIPLKPWHGVVWFVVVLIALFFGGSLVQLQLGMAGLAITELGLLVLALLPLLIFDISIKEMLPIKVPKVRHVVGTILLWMGAFLLSTLSVLIIGFFFPEGLTQVSSAMGGLMTSVPGFIAFLVIAVMPAICEEALHRGLILSSMRSIKKDWVIVLVMGLIFGVFHLDPIRFLATAILGAALTYVMLKTRNFLLPVLLHLINNSVSLIASFAAPVSDEVMQSDAVAQTLSSGASVAVYLIIGAVAPLLIFFATRLLTKQDAPIEDTGAAVPKKSFLKPLFISLGIGAVMMITGITILLTSVFSQSINFIQSGISINDDSEPIVHTFTVEQEKVYNMSYSMTTGIGVIEMTITDEDGTVIYQTEAQEIFGSDQLTLKEGTYTATFRFLISEYEQYAEEKGYPYTDDVKADLNLDGDLTETFSADISLIMV